MIKNITFMRMIQTVHLAQLCYAGDGGYGIIHGFYAGKMYTFSNRLKYVIDNI